MACMIQSTGPDSINQSDSHSLGRDLPVSVVVVIVVVAVVVVKSEIQKRDLISIGMITRGTTRLGPPYPLLPPP